MYSLVYDKPDKKIYVGSNFNSNFDTFSAKFGYDKSKFVNEIKGLYDTHNVMNIKSL